MAKLIVGGLATALSVITLIVFGYRGRRQEFDPIPQTLLEHTYILYTLVILTILSIAGWFILSVWVQDIHTSRWIEIEGHKLATTMNSKPITINLRTANETSFRIMPLFQLFFKNEFHRIGHLRVTTRHGSQSFYFPVRNDFIAEELKSVVSGKG